MSLTPSGTVLAETTPENLHLLRRVQLDLPSAESFGRDAFEVDLGSFLGNLGALSKWGSGDVTWSQSLRELAISALDDADHLERLRADDQSAHVEVQLEEDWRGNLTSFQERDLRGLLRMRHGANFSVPGAGKTRVALALLSHLRSSKRVNRALVVAPKSAHESWLRETSAVFDEARRVLVYSGGVAPECDILIVNYERLAASRLQLAKFLSRSPSILILDEAHRMKRGANGVYGAVCLSLGPLASTRLILSGTPAPNGLSDLKSLFEFVWPGRGSRLLGIGSSEWDTVSTTVQSLFTRTTKSELGLPPLQVTTRTVELPPLHREIYDALLGQLRTSVAAGERVDDLGRIIVYLLMAATSPALLAVGSSQYEPLQFRVPPFEAPRAGLLRSLLAELPRYEMSPKILEAARIARENAKQGRKTLVWSTFIRNLSTLKTLIPELDPQLIVGSTSDEDRTVALDRFRTNPGTSVLLSNPATLGEGVSLHHECHDAVYIDRDFAAGRFLQSLDRIHRLGLAAGTETRATVLVAASTIDELVSVRLARKLSWMSDALDDPALSALADLEEERENGDVLDASDAESVWTYLGNDGNT
ncbi:DEAD/DEAH box helicase [Microbacterium sp. NPDC087592]|uniref:DEAD/DEAH box helicase n=1 Tax=Microbacterium sp. NPDC087592 TaxID=3364193 RepID=UPI0038180F70